MSTAAGGSNKKGGPAGATTGENSVRELARLLDRVESRVAATREQHWADKRKMAQQASSASSSPVRGIGRFLSSSRQPRRSVAATKSSSTLSASSAADNTGSAAAKALSQQAQERDSRTLSATTTTTAAAAAAAAAATTTSSSSLSAEMAIMEQVDQMVEDLRRTAELVMIAENFVTALQKKQDRIFARDKETWTKRRDRYLLLDDSLGSFDNNHNSERLYSSNSLDQAYPSKQQHHQSPSKISNDRGQSTHISRHSTGLGDSLDRVTSDEVAQGEEYAQLFDLFVERHGLETMVNLATGAALAFTPSPSDLGVADSKGGASSSAEASLEKPLDPVLLVEWSHLTVLPPLAVATQAVQSVSMLIQNASRATSLYVLLSNNHINTLIDLPLQFYALADKERQHAVAASSPPRKNSPPPVPGVNPQWSELTTHFVTFLKSLALRMNAETLQFFLKYPTETHRGDDRDARPASARHFAEAEAASTLSPPSSSSSSLGDPRIVAVDVEFPLYERALEFCGAHQDSFVRVTAMNICLNTLRLTTVAPSPMTVAEEAAPHPPDDDEEHDELLGKRPPAPFVSHHHPSMTTADASSPDGTLHNAQPLPFRERLAIAQFACAPTRVERLIAPIFTKLAERWNAVEEQIRETEEQIQALAATASSVSAQDKVAKAKEKVKRERLLRAMKDKLADLQDELLLLEDVFRVGLTVLNEQMVEMMFATFVYPLLLQPLLLYYQRFVAAFDPSRSTFTDPLGGFAGDISDVKARLAPASGPAKAALITLASVFQSLTNRPLMRLLFVALFHPLSPDSTRVPTVRSRLVVAMLNRNGDPQIRLDEPTSDSPNDRSSYPFGTSAASRRQSSLTASVGDTLDDKEACVFVLAPALAEVLEFNGNDWALISRTKPNPYRSAVLRCLTLPDGLAEVRDLAVCVVDAACSAFNSTFVASIIFGTDVKSQTEDNPMDEVQLDSKYAYMDDRGIGGSASHASRQSLPKKRGTIGGDYMSEAVSALCGSVVTVLRIEQGGWQLVFDEVAVHALLCAIRCNGRAINRSAKLIANLWRKAARWIATERPYAVISPMGRSRVIRGCPSVNDPDYEDRIFEAFIEELFYGDAESSDPSAVESMFQLLNDVDKKSTGTGHTIDVSFAGNYDTLASRLCKLPQLADEQPLDDYELQKVQGRKYVSAWLKLDALASLLQFIGSSGHLLIRNCSLSGTAFSRNGVAVDLRETFVLEQARQLYGMLLPDTSELLYGDDRHSLITGSSVHILGNQSIPCVCEVPSSSAALFGIESTGVVDGGVTWQSLYLLCREHDLLLVQPLPDNATGEGRVISACHLERVWVETDSRAQVGDNSHARRLLLSYTWFDQDPPPLFLFDEMPEKVTLGPFVRMQGNTSKLDLWFENQQAADAAFRILSKEIFAAKAHRGRRLLTYLSPPNTSTD